MQFDFHNDSCQGKRKVSDQKLPTLPNSPRLSDVRISGYHFVEWSDGQASPRSGKPTHIEITYTTTTLSASGWLEKASCRKSPSGNELVQETFWQAAVVPEVRFVEDEEHEEPVEKIVDASLPKTATVLTLSSSCTAPREQSLQYSVAPVRDGAAQIPVYTSPVLNADKAGFDNYTTPDSVHIQAQVRPHFSRGKTQLSLTISGHLY